MSSVDVMDITECPGMPLAQIDARHIRKQQREDTLLGYWIPAVKDNRPILQHPRTRDHLTMFRSFRNFKMERGVLYREVEENGHKKKQLVLPTSLIRQALQGAHDDMGHPGRDRTMSVLKDRFWWPGMTSDYEGWVRNCDRCVRRKSSTNIRAPLVGITSSYPT